jgi:AcrR family transcriptional regulator
VPRPSNSAAARERIVAAAVALIDGGGIEALSMRTLGRELGIRGPTLYHYFADKTALLDAVRERIAEELWTKVEARLDGVPAGDWEGVLRGYLGGAVATMAEHPNAVGFMALRPVSSRRTLRGYEMVLERLTASGWSIGFAWQVFLAAENLMLAAALEAGAPAFRPPPGQLDELPLLRAVVEATARDPQLDDGYPVGLEALIAGIRSVLESGVPDAFVRTSDDEVGLRAHEGF